MSFSRGGITDVNIWSKAFSDETIMNLSTNKNIPGLDKPILSLPLRYSNIPSAINDNLFIAKNIEWSSSTKNHPREESNSFIYPLFKSQSLSNPNMYAALGALEYKCENYENSLRLLVMSSNNGRYTTQAKVNFRRSQGGFRIQPEVAAYLAMAYYKNDFIENYSELKTNLNRHFIQFDAITSENVNEMDVMQRIKLKALQKALNNL